LWLNHNKLQKRGKIGMAINLAAARVNANLSRKQVCEALGIHLNTISNYEAYTTTPDMETADKLCRLYGCTFDDIKWTKD
jgi:DNA-binding XRE family transcriptional regulator